MTFRLRPYRYAGFMLALAVAVAACGPGLRQEVYRDPGSVLPAFSPGTIADHLRAVGGPVDRSTGSPGLLEAANYAASVWIGAGLQPLTAGDFRVRAFGPLSMAGEAQLIRFSRDTVIVGTEAGVVADARASAGTMRAGSVWMPDPGTARRSDPAVAPVAIVTKADTTLGALEALRDRGVKAVIEMVEAVPTVAPHPIEGLLVLRADSSVVRRIIGADVRPGRVFQADLLVRVVTAYDPATPIINVLGYVPGRDPVLRNELVVVGTGLDHAGAPSEQGAETGAERVAAVIEAARILAALADAGEAPERTTLFALWSGDAQEHSGLRSWLASPGWLRSAVHAVVVMDRPSAARVEEAGLPVRLLRPDAVKTPASENRSDDRPRRNIGTAQTERVASLAHRLLVEIASALWERDGESRVPPLTSPLSSNEFSP